MPTGTASKAHRPPAGADWLDDARAVPLPDVVRALALDVARDGSFGPCPGCGAASRANPGRTDRRKRCSVKGAAWHCYSNGTDGCGAKGDGVALVAWTLTGKPWASGDRTTGDAVRGWYAGNGWCDPAPGQGVDNPGQPRTRRVEQAPPEPVERPRPPAAEVADLWARCVPVTADPDAVAWLLGRTDPDALDPDRLAALDVVRALPRNLGKLPRWARYNGQSWAESGHRLIVQGWEADPDNPGRLRWASLHARNIHPGHTDRDKAAWPAGATSVGLVLANGPDVTAHGLPVVELAEGVPDWLRLVQARAELPDGERPAVLAVWNGSADPDVAALVPDGWAVAIRTHDDQAGEKYARQWAELLGKRCTLRRHRKHNPPQQTNGNGPRTDETGADWCRMAVEQIGADRGNPEALALAWLLVVDRWGADRVPVDVERAHRLAVGELDPGELETYRAGLARGGGQ